MAAPQTVPEQAGRTSTGLIYIILDISVITHSTAVEIWQWLHFAIH